MQRLLRFEFVRLIRSGVAAMTIALILAICILGMVLDYVCYSNNSPMASMISIYKGGLNEGALSKSSVSSENLSCEILEEQFRDVVNKQLNEIVCIKW